MKSEVFSNKKLIVALVGLPARGKSYVSKKLCKFFNWLNISTQIFNVGNYRRQFEGRYSGNDFFDASNNSAQEIRQLSADAAMNDMIDWLNNRDGEIAFFDATNTTRERREWIENSLKDQDLDLLYLEILCDDENTINDNIVKVKLLTADYANFQAADAIKDFMTRISHYESVYEPIDTDHDSNRSFIQIINKGEKYGINKIDSIYKNELYKFVKSIRLTNRSIKMCVDLPKNLLEKMTKTSQTVIEISMKNDNVVAISGSDSSCKDPEREEYFRHLYLSKENIDVVAVQLIPFILESENHEQLSVVCDSRISKVLLKYFKSDFSAKDLIQNSGATMLRIDCNCNTANYSVQLIM